MGIGIATFVEPERRRLGERAGAHRGGSGRVTVATGSSSHGQGHETSFAQIAGDTLQVPLSTSSSATAILPSPAPGVGTFGSRSTVLGGTALIQAGDAVVAKARRIAAGLLEASPDDVRLEQGQFRITGVADRAVTWAQVAAVAYGRGKLPPARRSAWRARPSSRRRAKPSASARRSPWCASTPTRATSTSSAWSPSTIAARW